MKETTNSTESTVLEEEDLRKKHLLACHILASMKNDIVDHVEIIKLRSYVAADLATRLSRSTTTTKPVVPIARNEPGEKSPRVIAAGPSNKKSRTPINPVFPINYGARDEPEEKSHRVRHMNLPMKEHPRQVLRINWPCKEHQDEKSRWERRIDSPKKEHSDEKSCPIQEQHQSDEKSCRVRHPMKSPIREHLVKSGRVRHTIKSPVQGGHPDEKSSRVRFTMNSPTDEQHHQPKPKRQRRVNPMPDPRPIAPIQLQLPEQGYIIDRSLLPKLPPLEELRHFVEICSPPYEKQITPTDVDDGQSRISLSRQFVKDNYLKMLKNNEDLKVGINVTTYGRDGEAFDMVFKFWCEKTYVITSGWKKFVKRYGLEAYKHWARIWMFRHSQTNQLCFVVTWTYVEECDSLVGKQSKAGKVV